MELIDKSGLKRYSEHLLKTNKVVYMICPSADRYTKATDIKKQFISVLNNKVSDLYNVNQGTIIVKDSEGTDRGVASYIGNGADTMDKMLGYMDAYLFDSSTTTATNWARINICNRNVNQIF